MCSHPFRTERYWYRGNCKEGGECKSLLKCNHLQTGRVTRLGKEEQFAVANMKLRSNINSTRRLYLIPRCPMSRSEKNGFRPCRAPFFCSFFLVRALGSLRLTIRVLDDADQLGSYIMAHIGSIASPLLLYNRLLFRSFYWLLKNVVFCSGFIMDFKVFCNNQSETNEDIEEK
jgi:hypothetical protein